MAVMSVKVHFIPIPFVSTGGDVGRNGINTIWLWSDLEAYDNYNTNNTQIFSDDTFRIKSPKYPFEFYVHNNKMATDQ